MNNPGHSPIDDVLGFFDHLGKVEAEVHAGLLVDELDMMDGIKLRKKLRALIDGKANMFLKLPQRSVTPKPEWLEKARSRKTSTRTVFAAQVATSGDDTFVPVYCDEYVGGPHGMWNRFAIGYVGDFLMVVAREVQCGDCGGTGCGQCKRRGWQYVVGRELGKLTERETRKLVAPANAASLALYEAMS